MLLLLRQIRRKMIKKNKFTTYLLYAIGEIILVVVGILIAVNIDDWNKESARTQLEKKVLLELAANLKRDSIDHTSNFKFYKRIQRSNKFVVEQIELSSVWNDSMQSHYANIFTHGLATLNMAGYENLKSIGFDLITNDSLRADLTDHYSVQYTKLTKFEDELAADNQTNVITPVALKRVRMLNWGKAEPIDYVNLLSDNEFIEVVRWKINSARLISQLYDESLAKTINLMNLIRKDLEHPKFN